MKRFFNFAKTSLAVIPLCLVFLPMLALSSPPHNYNTKPFLPKTFKAPLNTSWKSSNEIYTNPDAKSIFFSNEQISDVGESIIKHSQVFSSKIANETDISKNHIINNGSNFPLADTPNFGLGYGTVNLINSNNVSYLTHFNTNYGNSVVVEYTVSTSNGENYSKIKILNSLNQGVYLGYEPTHHLSHETVLVANNKVQVYDLDKIADTQNGKLSCDTLSTLGLHNYNIEATYVGKDGWFFTTQSNNAYKIYYVTGFDNNAKIENITISNQINVSDTVNLKSADSLSTLVFSAKYDSLVATDANNQLLIINKNKAFNTGIKNIDASYMSAAEFDGTVPVLNVNGTKWISGYYPELANMNVFSKNNVANQQQNSSVAVQQLDRSYNLLGYYKLSINGTAQKIALGDNIPKSTIVKNPLPQEAIFSRIIASDLMGQTFINYVLSTKVDVNKAKNEKIIDNTLDTQINGVAKEIYNSSTTVSLVNSKSYTSGWEPIYRSIKYTNYFSFAITQNHSYGIIDQTLGLGGIGVATDSFKFSFGKFNSLPEATVSYETNHQLNLNAAPFENYFYYYGSISVYQNTVIAGARGWLLTSGTNDLAQINTVPNPIVLQLTKPIPLTPLNPSKPYNPNLPKSSGGLSITDKIIISAIVPVGTVLLAEAVALWFFKIKKNTKKQKPVLRKIKQNKK